MPAARRLLLLLLVLFAPALASAQVHIENRPTLRYSAAGAEREVAAEVLTLDVVRERMASRLSLRAPPTAQGAAAHCDGPRMVAAVVEAADVAATASVSFEPATASLVVVEAPGSNRDAASRETLTVEVAAGGVARAAMLTETAPNSGVFAGVWPADRADLAPCAPAPTRGAALTLAFAGDEDSLPVRLTLPVDPGGLVFDAGSGAPVDGASVTLLTEAGTPAAVFGADGVSRYPATVTSGVAVTDAGGRGYAAVAGGYRFPVVAPGRYRLRVAPPGGYRAPSAVPASVLAELRDGGGEPFRVTEASRGEVLVLAEAGPAAADIPLDRVATRSLVLTRTQSVREATPGDRVEVRLHLTNRGTAASGALHLVDTLPAALRYRAGSMRGAAEPALASDGRSLDVSLSSLAPGGSIDLRYLLAVVPGAASGEAVMRAEAQGPWAVGNIAAAAVRIRPLPFTDALTVLGQVGEGGCTASPRGVGGVRLLLEDGSVVVTDPGGLYHLEGLSAGRHVLAIDTATLPPGLEPVDCARDTASGGSATSRFVEGVGGLVRRVDFRLRRTALAPAVLPSPAGPSDDAAAAGDHDWLAGCRPGSAWLFPAADYNPRAPVTRVVIQHAPGERVALTIDGRRVDPLSFDATDEDGHGVAVSRWVGIPLSPGANRLAARVLAADGRLVATLERTVTVSGPAVRAVVDPAHSRLLADGVTPPLIAVRVTDAAGRPVRAGTLVPFTLDNPAAAALDPLTGRVVEGVPVTGDDGLALLPLRPTAQAGAVRAHLAFQVGEAAARVSDAEAWLTPAATGWTVVGFGAGTLGHDTLSRHARALAPGERDRQVGEGQLALYARGRIRGSWLLTMAYDSARRFDPDRALLGQVDPNRYYTVYGDGAVQGQDAATAGRLYLRLEGRQATALFGDMQTDLGEAQLTRYARTLTGARAAYRGERWRASGFAARVATLARHDEIAGNGLTGPYRLRAAGIVPGSDTLRVEVRDRLRPDRVVASTPMARHLDYEIDSAAGTLRFAAPVLGRDAGLNPVVIVADYEVEGGHAGRLAAGGRVEYRAGRLAIGAAVIHDETRTATAGVAGVDARIEIAPGTALKAEVASGGDRGLAGGGRAVMAEVEHHRAGLDLVTYARQQALGFGLGQQNLVEAGTRKLGGDLHWAGATFAGGEVGVTGTGWYQAMLAGPGERIAGQARVDWRRGTRTVFAGVDVATDHGLGGAGASAGGRASRLLTFGASQVLANGALTLTGQTQLAPGGAADSIDFPARHRIEAAWRLTPALRLIGGYEIADGASVHSRTAQLGIDVMPWHGARVATSVNDRGGGEAGRRFVQASIAQSLPLGAHWSLDATVDSAATLAGSRLPVMIATTAFQPVATTLAQDTGDYQAATLGAAFRAGRWSARGRAEYRRGATDARRGITLDVLRDLGEGRTLAGGARLYRVTDALGTTAASVTADLALAWRPPTSRWTLLDRLTLRHDRGDPLASAASGAALGSGVLLVGGDQLTTRLIDSLALDYRSTLDGRGHGIEASLAYGIKYVRGRYADESVDGLIDATALAVRRGLGPHLDIGVAASVQHGWSDRRWAWSGGPALGLSPAGDVWMTLGYNIAGYRDRDLAGDCYTRAGPYLTVRLKVDSVARLLGRGR